jgi:hypothetical protein
MAPASLSVLLSIAPLFHVALGAAVTRLLPRGEEPGLTYDPNTTPYCTWWVDLTSNTACSTILSENAINLDTFRRWVSAAMCLSGVNNEC